MPDHPALPARGTAAEREGRRAGFASPLETSDLTRSGHFGLVGMHERAQYIGARLEVSSRPEGDRITLRCLLGIGQSAYAVPA